ncbi:MAG: heme-binding domain-containing protein [Crocinitomicaceae bacterium]|nr:heme-binding domain-containing protein [Crocinitomicaceae bacterium]
MKFYKKVLIVLLVAFVGIQFIPTNRNQSNEVLSSDISLTYDVPENIQSILKTSCYDCHSNNTEYPWYNKIQPISWLLEGHVEEGKSDLNFSEFGSYSIRRQKSKLRSMESQIEHDEMPLSSYTLMNRNAKISDQEKLLLLDWINNLRDSL